MNRLQELRDFLPEVDKSMRRHFAFVVEEVRDSGAKDVLYEVRGHAAVFDEWSLDLGGFRERIMPGAFDPVLAREPHVVHVWDHDTQRVLSSTPNGTLKLAADDEGLAYQSRVAPTSYAKDLKVLLERGDIDQSSFAFTVARDEWRIVDEGGEEIVERSILEVRDLYDVTTTAMGAYPQTTSELAVRTLASARNLGAEAARFFTLNTGSTGSATTSSAGTITTNLSFTPPGGTTEVTPPEDRAAEPDVVGDRKADEAAERLRLEAMKERVAELKRTARDETQAARNRLHGRDKA